MDVEQFRECCLALPLVTEDLPFDDTLLVFRLKGKIFACVPLDKPVLGVMKCDADLALELRDHYAAVEPAYHWNKKYWNQVRFDGDVADSLFVRLVRHAYNEVNKKLPKKDRVEPLVADLQL